MFLLYSVLGDMDGSMFHTRMVSSEEQVMKEPGGSRPFTPSPGGGYVSTPQIQAEWYKYEWDLPTCNEGG